MQWVVKPPELWFGLKMSRFHGTANWNTWLSVTLIIWECYVLVVSGGLARGHSCMVTHNICQHMYFLVYSRNMPFWTKKVTSSFLAGRSCEYHFKVFTLKMEIGENKFWVPKPETQATVFREFLLLEAS